MNRIALHPKLVVTYTSDTCSFTVYDTVPFTVYDTVSFTVHDTVKITVFDTVAVADTLVINIPTGLNPPNNSNLITIFPNPTMNLIYIDNGNFSLLSNHTLKITDISGREVFSSLINLPSFTVNMSNFGGAGLFFIRVFNSNNQPIAEKKIVLQ